MPRPRRNELPRPFLKWAGGKTQLLPQLEALFPPPGEVKRYLEPFVGSGAVFFHVQKLFGTQDAVLSDSNPELIDTYVALRDDVDSVIRGLRRHKQVHSKEHYYRVRSRRPSEMPLPARAARMIYLNKTCFNGLHRVNSCGQFNVPLGRYENPPILDADNLRAVATALRSVTLSVAHFRETLKGARKGDFIYFDPPYQPLSPTSSFTGYTQNAFGERDQEELADVFRRLAERGCKVMLSNSDAPLIHHLYKDFALQVRKVDSRRTINSKPDRRGAIQEVVVLSYAPQVAPLNLPDSGTKQPSPSRRRSRAGIAPVV